MTKAPTTEGGARRDAAAAPKSCIEPAAGHVARRLVGGSPKAPAAGAFAPPLRRAAARNAA